jgi:gamma-glutamylcyclotransferase (GGCT)/AIG2-like uncharacterized protein YtfP
MNGEIGSCTYDAPLLQTMKNQYVFCYGTLKHGFPRYNRLVAGNKNIKLLGSGVTVDKCYTMYNLKEQKGASFPLVFEDFAPEPDTKSYKITGDLLLVPTPVMYDLDEIEQNGKYYSRQKRDVSIMAKIPNGERGHEWTQKVVSAWIYIARIGSWYHNSPMRLIQPGNHGVARYTMEQCYDFDNASKQEPVIKFI